MKRLMAVMIIGLALAPPALAIKNAVLVVSEAGNDRNAGTFDKPVKTLHQAIVLAKPGDRIIIVIGAGKIEFRVDPDYRLIQIGFGKTN